MDISKLKGHLPETIYNQLHEVQSFGVDGPKRLSHLLGNCKHETMQWKKFTENLNYSAQGLISTFPKYFPDLATANLYARQPEKIANRVYANRMGNGDEHSGEGWLHRGMGCIQLTGKSNQQAFFTAMGLPTDTNPELIATDYSLLSAAWFFKTNGLWVICDEGVEEETCKKVCKKVNGAYLGLEDRKKYTQEFYNILTGTI